MQELGCFQLPGIVYRSLQDGAMHYHAAIWGDGREWTNCSQVEIPIRTTSMQESFPEKVSDSLCRNALVMQTDCCSSCPGGWSQDDLGGEDAGCGGPGLVWIHVVCGCEAGWMYCQILWNALKLQKRLKLQFMVDKWTFNSQATALVDILAISMPIARYLKNSDICGIVLW